MKRFTQFFDLAVIANQFAEGTTVMLDFIALAIGILVMFFALLKAAFRRSLIFSRSIFGRSLPPSLASSLASYFLSDKSGLGGRDFGLAMAYSGAMNAAATALAMSSDLSFISVFCVVSIKNCRVPLAVSRNTIARCVQ